VAIGRWTQASTSHQALIGVAAFAIVMTREVAGGPLAFSWEEPAYFWERGALLDPWGGYVVVIPRLAFAIGHLVPPIAPTVTVAFLAATIALVAAFLASDRMAVAIPNEGVRLAFALSIALLPLPTAYLSPLDVQWFLALYLAGLSLTPDIRRIDYLGVAAAGLSGIAGLLALPLFWRDRRLVVLIVAAAIQAGTLLASQRPAGGLGISIVFAVVAMLVVLTTMAEGLPVRTRLAFGYLGIVTLVLGSWAVAGSAGGSRFLVAAVAALALAGIAAVSARKTWAVVLLGFLLAGAILGFPVSRLAG
jgi:hypothetical protein